MERSNDFFSSYHVNKNFLNSKIKMATKTDNANRLADTENLYIYMYQVLRESFKKNCVEQKN